MIDSSIVQLKFPLAKEAIKEIKSWDYIDKIEISDNLLRAYIKDYESNHQKFNHDIRVLLRLKVGSLKLEKSQ